MVCQRVCVLNVKKIGMEYKEIKGDLISLALDGKFTIIGHGCNCMKAMGAGIAYSMRTRLPEAYFIDNNDDRMPSQRLGDYTITDFIMDVPNLRVVNLYTQFYPGKNLDYEALTLSLRKLNMYFPGEEVGLPLIGCGIGGGDWRKVKKIIKQELKDMKSVTIVKFIENAVNSK